MPDTLRRLPLLMFAFTASLAILPVAYVLELERWWTEPHWDWSTAPDIGTHATAREIERVAA